MEFSRPEYWMSLSELRELVMDTEAWRAVIHGVEKKIPWTEEPGGLQSTGVAESDTTAQLSTDGSSM